MGETVNILYKYKNGNTEVTILEDGTKIREFEDVSNPEFPESIDVKITDYCDLECKYCHENSTIEGKIGDINLLIEEIKHLPKGVELALGGGNPLSHPNLVDLLMWMKDNGYIANLTVNQKHLKEYYSMLEKFIKDGLVKGLGISITSPNFKYVKQLMKITPNIVFHVIAGVNPVSILHTLKGLSSYCKVLILGYKAFGRGIEYKSNKVDKNLHGWYMQLYSHLRSCTISFDNLAIEQLNVKKFFTEEGWNKFYMGDDFTNSMYIDLVSKYYAPTSRSNDRISMKELNIKTFFQNYRGRLEIDSTKQ